MSVNKTEESPDREYFSRDEIPEIVLEELKSNFKNVNFATYGNAVNEDCRTRAFQSIETVAEDTWCKVIDSKTFEPKMAMHVDKVRSFKIRGVFTEDSVDVYAIGSIYAIRQRPDTKYLTVEELAKLQGDI